MGYHMKLQTFIFNWNRVDSKVEQMYDQLQSAGIDVTVINSTDNPRDGWLNVGDDYWCYGQTYTAFNNFDDSTLLNPFSRNNNALNTRLF